MTALEINEAIKASNASPEFKAGEISDGYHTFDELYEHRITLYIALCRQLQSNSWRTLLHSDGSSFEGWFVLGLNYEGGDQITYHLPIEKWDLCRFAADLEKAPQWDGHGSIDVLTRISKL